MRKARPYAKAFGEFLVMKGENVMKEFIEKIKIKQNKEKLSPLCYELLRKTMLTEKDLKKGSALGLAKLEKGDDNNER